VQTVALYTLGTNWSMNIDERPEVARCDWRVFISF
jgi:hypothetical protein